MVKVAKRIRRGWTEYQTNKQKYNCDDCGARLWVAPDGKSLYCNFATPKHERKLNG